MVHALTSAHAPQSGALAGLQRVGAIGVHPWWIDGHDDGQVAQALDDLDDALGAATSVGECGLDFARQSDKAARTRQVEALRVQLELARRTGRSCVLHCVRAHATLLEMIDASAIPPSIVHGFSGSAELARAYVQRGHFISFCGSVTLPQARKIRAAAQSVPDSMLLIETDSPDQTPLARRPAENEPAFIVDVAREIAELRDADLSTIAELTYDNARRVFQIS